MKTSGSVLMVLARAGPGRWQPSCVETGPGWSRSASQVISRDPADHLPDRTGAGPGLVQPRSESARLPAPAQWGQTRRMQQTRREPGPGGELELIPRLGGGARRRRGDALGERRRTTQDVACGSSDLSLNQGLVPNLNLNQGFVSDLNLNKEWGGRGATLPYCSCVC